MIYDLIIVGSGPVALSCIIEAPRNLNIAVISQNYDTGYRLDSFGDKAYSESFGGGLDSWHGVLSSNLFLKFFPNNIDHYKNFYNKFYLDNKLNNEDFSMNKIFIPRKKISSKALLNSSLVYCLFGASMSLKIPEEEIPCFFIISCSSCHIPAKYE